jgi:peptidoglycan/xylan/chitin deacetylase (PgdA/CDA1 family)
MLFLTFCHLVGAKIGFFMLYLPKMPKFIQKLFPSALFRMASNEKKIYLTFDDGPTPEVTTWVFEQLQRFNAFATFFWVGENIKQHPEYIEDARKKGHTIGNHTFHHLSGWKTSHDIYLQDIAKCDNVLTSKFFRPPYGEMTWSQYRSVKKQRKVVLWDVVSYDFDTETSPEKCLKNVMDNVSPGSIVVFHDSRKAWPNLKKTLPIVMQKLAEEGYSFDTIN